jgi:hypothetical protein
MSSLGVILDSFSPVCKFYGVLLQIAHRGQCPISKEPAFRILRFVNSKAEANAAIKALQEKVEGNILLQLHNGQTLICTDLDRQTSADYILSKTASAKQEYLQYVKFLDEDFAENRRARREGLQDEARARHKAYMEAYNQKGWVKFMRAEKQIAEDIDIVPGMHAEAEELNKRRAAAAVVAAAPALAEEEEEEENKDCDFVDDDSTQIRKKGQRYAAVSTIIDDSADMEVLLFVHAVYSDLKSAKEHVESELNDILHPLAIDVVDMYEWVYPVRMQWENNHLSKQITDLEETWHNEELGNTQMERSEAAKKNRKLKQDILKKKEMDASVQQQVAEHLGITGDQLMIIMDAPDFGAKAVIAWAQINNSEERSQKVQAALETLL